MECIHASRRMVRQLSEDEVPFCAGEPRSLRRAAGSSLRGQQKKNAKLLIDESYEVRYESFVFDL